MQRLKLALLCGLPLAGVWALSVPTHATPQPPAAQNKTVVHEQPVAYRGKEFTRIVTVKWWSDTSTTTEIVDLKNMKWVDWTNPGDPDPVDPITDKLKKVTLDAYAKIPDDPDKPKAGAAVAFALVYNQMAQALKEGRFVGSDGKPDTTAINDAIKRVYTLVNSSGWNAFRVPVSAALSAEYQKVTTGHVQALSAMLAQIGGALDSVAERLTDSESAIVANVALEMARLDPGDLEKWLQLLMEIIQLLIALGIL